MNEQNNTIQTTEINPAEITGDLTTRIETILAANKVTLFMKGNAEMPQCGFSANTVMILKNCRANFATFNILADMDIREGLKEYSNWPTFPQLYIGGKLVGGNDIITEMFESGDLKEALDMDY